MMETTLAFSTPTEEPGSIHGRMELSALYIRRCPVRRGWSVQSSSAKVNMQLFVTLSLLLDNFVDTFYSITRLSTVVSVDKLSRRI